MFQGCLKGVSSVFQGCFKEDCRVTQWNFIWVSKVCKEVHWVFEESFQGVSRMFEGCLKED